MSDTGARSPSPAADEPVARAPTERVAEISVNVRNLPHGADSAALRDHFRKCSNEDCITDTYVPHRDGKHAAFGFVKFPDVAAAEVAIAEMNDSDMGGNVLHVQMALERRKPRDHMAGGRGGRGGEECHDFKVGRCSRGDSCRFSHGQEGGGGGRGRDDYRGGGRDYGRGGGRDYDRDRDFRGGDRGRGGRDRSRSRSRDRYNRRDRSRSRSRDRFQRRDRSDSRDRDYRDRRDDRRFDDRRGDGGRGGYSGRNDRGGRDGGGDRRDDRDDRRGGGRDFGRDSGRSMASRVGERAPSPARGGASPEARLRTDSF